MAVVCCGIAAAATAGGCALSDSALGRFKYETFYGWHERDGGWTNVGQSSAVAEIWKFWNDTGRASLYEAQSVFFQPMAEVNASLRGLALRPDAFARWEAAAGDLRSLAEAGALVGVFLGDELVWNNISWADVGRTSAAVKGSFPSLFVWYNEGGAPLYASKNINGYRIEYPHVPESVDFVSSDDYGTMYQVKNPVWFYAKYLKPKVVYPHQRLFVVPPVFGRASAGCDAECVDAGAEKEAAAYLSWISNDSSVVGMSGFHLGTYGADLGLDSLPKTLRCYQAVAAQLIGHA